MLSETAFIIQHNCSQVQPCLFCKCYLIALSVLIYLTEFIKHLLWARCHADVGRRGVLRSVIGKAQDLRKLREGGAISRLGDREGKLLGLVLRHM